MLFNRNLKIGFLITSLCVFISPGHGQIADFPSDTVAGIPVNYTEANVGQYSLPDLLKCSDGETVENTDIWFKKRRPEIVELFEQHQYGTSPARPENIRYNVFDHGSSAFEGKAKRTQTTIYFSDDADEPKMDFLLYVPGEATQPVPLLLYIAFTANSMVVDDPGVKTGYIWNRDKQKVPANKDRRFEHLNVTDVLEKGFAIATVYYGDIEPDFQDGAKYGVRSLFPATGEPDEWGSIAAWSWGLSRAFDYLENVQSIDTGRVAVMGISRLGKTVLWAGATDPRFALIIAICSGESGAALSRRNYGETVAHIAAPTRYEYWFAPRYLQYAENVNALPVDSHMLLSLIAPRPFLLITGNTDKWSDPYGEFLAAVAAEPIYTLLGKQGLSMSNMPQAGEPVLNDIGFYLHDGGHGTHPSDWRVILDFLQKNLQP